MLSRLNSREKSRKNSAKRIVSPIRINAVKMPMSHTSVSLIGATSSLFVSALKIDFMLGLLWESGAYSEERSQISVTFFHRPTPKSGCCKEGRKTYFLLEFRLQSMRCFFGEHTVFLKELSIRLSQTARTDAGALSLPGTTCATQDEQIICPSGTTVPQQTHLSSMPLLTALSFAFRRVPHSEKACQKRMMFSCFMKHSPQTRNKCCWISVQV